MLSYATYLLKSVSHDNSFTPFSNWLITNHGWKTYFWLIYIFWTQLSFPTFLHSGYWIFFFFFFVIIRCILSLFCATWSTILLTLASIPFSVFFGLKFCGVCRYCPYSVLIDVIDSFAYALLLLLFCIFHASIPLQWRFYRNAWGKWRIYLCEPLPFKFLKAIVIGWVLLTIFIVVFRCRPCEASAAGNHPTRAYPIDHFLSAGPATYFIYLSVAVSSYCIPHLTLFYLVSYAPLACFVSVYTCFNKILFLRAVCH